MRVTSKARSAAKREDSELFADDMRHVCEYNEIGYCKRVMREETTAPPPPELFFVFTKRSHIFSILPIVVDSIEKQICTVFTETMHVNTIRGVTLLSLGAFVYSFGALSFAKLGTKSSVVNTWVGILGAPSCIILLSIDKNFSVSQYVRDIQLYFCFMSGFIFGGTAIFCSFWSLEFILPSDNNMIVVFFHIVGSLFMHFREDGKFPKDGLTFLSILLGFVGTFFICNPEDIFTKNIMELHSIKGGKLIVSS